MHKRSRTAVNLSKALVLAAVTLAPAAGNAQLLQNLTIANPKALALGNAVTADPPGVDSVHFNPAGLARLRGRQYQLKSILADAKIAGEFKSTPQFENIEDTLGFEDPVADSKSEIDSFAIFLPGKRFQEIPIVAAPLGGVSYSAPGSDFTFATNAYAPLMLGMVRDKDDPGRFSGQKLAFTRITYFSPSVGYQLTDTLALGASFGLSYSGLAADITYRAPNVALAAARGLTDLACGRGSGVVPPDDPWFDVCGGQVGPFSGIFDLEVKVDEPASPSYNLGLLWEPAPWVTFGMAYQSPAKDTLTGQANLVFSDSAVNFFGGLADSQFGVLEALVDNLDLPTDDPKVRRAGTVDLELPQHFSMGTSIWVTERLKWNLDVKWTESSAWDELAVELDESVGGFSLLDALGVSNIKGDVIVLPRDYEDTWNWGTGIEYLYTRDLRLRLGYEPRNSGIPRDKRDFAIPLGKAYVYAAGFSYDLDQASRFDFTLAYITSEQEVPAGSSRNGNDLRLDNFLYNPYAGLDIESELALYTVEMSYRSRF